VMRWFGSRQSVIKFLDCMYLPGGIPIFYLVDDDPYVELIHCILRSAYLYLDV